MFSVRYAGLFSEQFNHKSAGSSGYAPCLVSAMPDCSPNVYGARYNEALIQFSVRYAGLFSERLDILREQIPWQLPFSVRYAGLFSEHDGKK